MDGGRVIINAVIDNWTMFSLVEVPLLTFQHTIPIQHSDKALRSLTQSLLDCILYQTQYFYDPHSLPSSAALCILGKVYLRSNLARMQHSEVAF